jgi:hypothetical protein
MPNTISENMPSEMSSVDRVRQVRITCGRKAKVVQLPATKPMMETPVNSIEVAGPKGQAAAGGA